MATTDHLGYVPFTRESSIHVNWPKGSRMRTLALAVVIALSASAAPVSAQSLKQYVAGAALDWGSTYLVDPPGSRVPCDQHQALDNTCRRVMLEINPTVNWVHNAKAQGALSAGLDLLAVWSAHRLVAQRHPKLFKVGLRAATGIRVGFGVWNLSTKTH